MRNNKGFGSLLVLLVVLVLVIIAGGYYWYTKNRSTNTPSTFQVNSPKPTNAPVSSSSALSSDLKLYTNSKLHFQFTYPSYVTLSTQSMSSISGGFKYLTVPLVLLPLKNTPCNGTSSCYPYEMNIIVWDNSQNKSINDLIGTMSSPVTLQAITVDGISGEKGSLGAQSLNDNVFVSHDGKIFQFKVSCTDSGNTNKNAAENLLHNVLLNFKFTY